MRIAVLGARGQLGAAVVLEAASAGHDVVPFDHQGLDVTDARAVLAGMTRVGPDAIVSARATTPWTLLRIGR
jgi:dTDP-4-dehydrorhamnose reductase